MKTFLCLCASVMLAALPVRAEIYTTNGRLDLVLNWKSNAPLVVSGRIVEASAKPRADIAHYPPDISLKFDVVRAILGDAKQEGRVLTIAASGFLWPSELVPLEQGSRCILILEPRRGEPSALALRAVVPVTTVETSAAANIEMTKLVLQVGIISELFLEKSPARQRALIQQVTPILTGDEAQYMAPFVKSRDPWVKRAALSAMVYAIEDSASILEVAEDTEHFWATTKPTDRIDNHYVAYSYFLENYYFFLDSRRWTLCTPWVDDEARKLVRIRRAMYGTGRISARVQFLLDHDGVEPAAGR